MGNRQTIYNLCKDVLEATTGINYVTQDININMLNLTEDKYPAIRLIDGPEAKERFAYSGGSTSLEDMQSEFPISYIGYVRSIAKSSTEMIDEQNNLTVTIETALTGDSTLLAAVSDIVPDEQMTDRGNIEGIGWVSGDYTITYFYNHSSP